MKKMLLGIALLLFGILLELAGLNEISRYSIFLVVDLLADLPYDILGLVVGAVGVFFTMIGCFEKKQ